MRCLGDLHAMTPVNKRKPRRFLKVGGVCRISIPIANYWWSRFLLNQQSDECATRRSYGVGSGCVG
jgi:hypothetical protein